MAEELEGITSSELTDQDEPVRSEGLDSLIRSVGRDSTKYYLDRSLGLTALKMASVAELVETITRHERREQVIGDLSKIRTFSRGINHETFMDLAREAGLQFDFNVPIRHLIVDFLLANPVAAEEAFVLSEVRWQTGYQEFKGKQAPNPLQLTEEIKTDLAETLRSLIISADPGRKCVVNVKQSQHEVLMSAYVQQRRKEYYTIGAEDQVTVEVVTPAARTSATYDMDQNRLKVKAGPSKKLLRYISEAFGKAMYGDNSFFSDPSHPAIYNLAPLKQPAFRLDLDGGVPQVVEARVTEETLRFMVGGQQVMATYQADDVEALLPVLSNEQVDLTAQERVSATIELHVNDGQRIKIVPIRLVRGNKIEFDPRYAEAVHHLLQKWGLELGS